VVGIMVLIVVGLGSSVLANIPLVAAMILMLKGYFVVAQLVPKRRSARRSPPGRLIAPVFVAMMFGGTLEATPRSSRLGQHRQRGDLRRQRKIRDVCEVYALRRSDDGVPAGRVGRLRDGLFF